MDTKTKTCQQCVPCAIPRGMSSHAPHTNEPGKEPDKFASPFGESTATLPEPKRQNRLALWIILGLALVVVGGFGANALTRILNDPLRTMETFPVAKYFEGYHALAGARFKGELRVENDLGWKDGMGRLMLFTTPNDSRPVAVLIPPSLGHLYFVKGQTYTAELEVKEGGLIHAISCKKN